MDRLYIVPILLFSVVVHELAHGVVALKLGDPTARENGRLTFNPIPHIDPFGSIIVPLFAFLANLSTFIAWAKPVPINPEYFKVPRRDEMLVSLAGPSSNLLLAFSCVLTAVFFIVLQRNIAIEEESLLSSVLQFCVDMFTAGIALNVMLALFNLIPIPPLDGSHVLAFFLPSSLAKRYQEIGFLGIFIVLFLLNIPGVRETFIVCVRVVTYPYFSLLHLLLQ
ncbi:MAG: site-2 protease family protein [Bacteroidetes bacterium]|nr:site-2 protease family protein [Bacteroidota bacterium]